MRNNNRITGLGIPSLPGVLLADLKVAKAGYFDGFPFFQGLFHDLEQIVNHFGGLLPGKTYFCLYLKYDVSFSHFSSLTM